jgi:biotin operon repressor
MPEKSMGYERPAGLPMLTVSMVAPLLLRLRCGACRARLQVEWPLGFAGRLYCYHCGREYAEIVDKLPTRLPLSDEDVRPRRGRPPKPGTGGALCPECQTQTVSRSRWARCSSCNTARRWSTSLARRLLDLLADGRRYGRDELHDALGVSNQQLRSAVQQARDRGWDIRLMESGYRLEGVS